MSTPENIAARLTQLRKARGPRRRHLEKLLAELSVEVDNEQALATEEILAKIIVKEAELTMVDHELEGLFLDDEIDAEMQETADFADRIIVAKVRANRLLASHKSATVTVTAKPSNKIAAKLPKLQIAKFDGKLTDWTRFYEQFSASIGDNTGLSEIDKFSYLRTLLTTQVGVTIQGLQLTGSNYSIALTLLQEKYGQPAVLKNEHVHALLRIRPVEYQEDGGDLRRFYEECQVHLRALEALGVPTDTLGVMLCPVLFQAMPYSMLQEWNRKHHGDKDEDLAVLLAFLQEELEGIERAWRAKALREPAVTGISSGEDHKQEDFSRFDCIHFANSSKDKELQDEVRQTEEQEASPDQLLKEVVGNGTNGQQS